MEPFLDLGIALGLGFLVGLQREWAGKPSGGIRTYPLIAMAGVVSGVLAETFGGWLAGLGLFVIGAMALSSRAFQVRRDPEAGVGMTTEVSVLLTFLVGLLLAADHRLLAISVAGIFTILLHWKVPMHRLVRGIEEDELRALIRLVLIGLVILPILPNRDMGPFGVLNPFRIWLMVVLIVGISLVAYVAGRYLGPGKGTAAGGIVGGLVSSTATTVGTAQQSKRSGLPDRAGAAVILIASTVVFLRVLFELSLVSRSHLDEMAPPLAVMMGWMTILSLVALRHGSREAAGASESREPPSGIWTAVWFGLLYALVLLAVAASKEYLGDRWLYGVAALSGLTDMDAITLSTGQLVESGKLSAETGWRAILIGGMANLVFKLVAVMVMATVALTRWVALYFGLSFAGGLALLVLWPG